MKIKLLLISILLVTLLSCQKEHGFFPESYESKEFWTFVPKNPVTTPGGYLLDYEHYTLQLALIDLQRMENSDGFKEEVLQFGMPLWDQSTEFFDAKKIKTVVTPIGDKENGKITAMLVINYSKGYKKFQYNIVERGGHYPSPIGKNTGKNLMSAQTWDGLFAALDKEVYNRGDSRGLYKEKRKIKNGASVSAWWFITTGFCQYGYVPSTGYTSPTTCTYTHEMVWVPDDLDPTGGEYAWHQSQNTGGGTIQSPLGEVTPAKMALSIDLCLELDINPSIIPCALVEMFRPLATFTPPAVVNNRMAALNQQSTAFTLFSLPFFRQQIQNAAGYLINFDRFEIDVANLPVVNGQQLSATQFLNYIRLNLNNFISGGAQFTPYYDPSDQINDATRWNSSNPLGAILSIDLPDDGSVIVSDYNGSQWTVSTIRTPIDGAHPVSGNRQWGFEPRTGGGYTFYVTGADRLTTGSHEFLQYMLGIPFNSADALWASYQEGVASFVNAHQGQANVGNVITARPDYDAIQAYYAGQITLEQLRAAHGCN